MGRREAEEEDEEEERAPRQHQSLMIYCENERVAVADGEG